MHPTLSRLSGLSVGIVVSTFTILLAAPSLADIRYVSRDGNLAIQYGGECSTVRASGFYRFRNGVAGELVAVNCDDTGGDIAVHRFTDTSGNERCLGRVTQSWGERVITLWQVDGTVPGYSCSRVRQSFEIEMDSGQEI